jgi:hypothetical protein
LSEKITKSKKGWGYGSSGRVLAQHVPVPPPQKKTKQKKSINHFMVHSKAQGICIRSIFSISLLLPLPTHTTAFVFVVFICL